MLDIAYLLALFAAACSYAAIRELQRNARACAARHAALARQLAGKAQRAFAARNDAAWLRDYGRD